MPRNTLPSLYDLESVRGWRMLRVAVFLLAGAAMIVWLIIDQRRAAWERELPRTGAAVQGRVDFLDSQRGGNRLGLSYTFVAGRTSYAIRDRRVVDFDGLRPSAPLLVWYDPGNPWHCVTANELRHPRHGWTPYLFSALVVVAMAAAAAQAYQIIQPRRDPEGEN